MATVKYVVAYGCRINGTAYQRLELVDLDDTDPAVIDAVNRGRIRDYDDVVTGIGTGDIADGAITNDKVNATAGIAPSKIAGTAVVTTDPRLSGYNLFMAANYV